jgi:pimeloyl-ACP methyl ester carboxylesterase
MIAWRLRAERLTSSDIGASLLKYWTDQYPPAYCTVQYSLEGRMDTVISRDGTAIAFDRSGTGPAVILVDGALCHRAFGPSRPLAEQLEPDFTVYTYDRRGRGESGDTGPYSVEREVEDLEALLVEAGGAAFVYGTSSGAALALEAARILPGVTKLVVYEPPFVVAESEPLPGEYLTRIEAAVTAGRRGEAVKLFMKQVGAPGFFVALLPVLPPWSKLKATAHTIPYDLTILSEGQRGRELRAEKFGSIKVPTSRLSAARVHRRCSMRCEPSRPRCRPRSTGCCQGRRTW